MQVGQKIIIVPIGNFKGNMVALESVDCQTTDSALLLPIEDSKYQQIAQWLKKQGASPGGLVGKKGIVFPLQGDKKNLGIWVPFALTVSGHVYDWRLNPLAGQIVYLDGSSQESNEDGEFSFGAAYGVNYELQMDDPSAYTPSKYTYSPLLTDKENQDFTEKYFEYIKFHYCCTPDTQYGRACVRDVAGQYGYNDSFVDLYVGNCEGVVTEDCETQKAIPFSNGSKVTCLLYTSPSPRDRTRSRMPSSA